jgi:cation diffusion facilitator CzcD-associated flavoprotein CzcO
MEGNEIIPHAGTYEEPQSNPVNAIEVTVIGGGLAGMAASIHLSRAGLRVLCLEPDVTDADSVGESLDWSAPACCNESPSIGV